MENGAPILSLKNISKYYERGMVKAIQDISLDIHQNEFVAIMGISGSGKSTLLNILGCLDQPTGGTYFLNGSNASTMEGDELAKVRNKDIGFVFQMFNLLMDHTALDNVILPMQYSGITDEEARQRAADMLKMVGMGDRLDHKPSEISGGQQQRIAIARALVNRPAIILADEPTGNLDTKTTKEIMDIFVDIHGQGNTVIFITHEEDIALYAQRIIRLRDGLVESDKKNTQTIPT